MNKFFDDSLPIFSLLKVLSMNYYYSYLPPIKLPTLKAPRFYCCSSTSNISSLENFLFINTQIEVFSFFNSDRIFCDEFGKHYSVLGSLKRLKALEIEILRNNPQNKINDVIEELLSNDVAIEHLKLHYLIIDVEAIEYISQMKTLRE